MRKNRIPANNWAFSPDCLTTVTASARTAREDKKLNLWDVTSGQWMKEFKWHMKGDTICAFTPSGLSVVAANGSTLRLWDVATGECEREFTSYKGRITSFALSPNGNMIVAAYVDDAEIGMSLWDVSTGEGTGFFGGHHKEIFNCHVADDGRIITVSDDTTRCFWDSRKSYESTSVIAARWSDSTSCSAFSPDGSRIVTGGRDGALFVTDLRTGDCVQELKTLRNIVLCVAFSPDGQSIAAATIDGSFRLWDAATGECTRVLEDGHLYFGDEMASCAFSSDNTHIGFTHSNQPPRLWSVATGECLTAVEDFEDDDAPGY